jgi:hypothetical protein
MAESVESPEQPGRSDDCPDHPKIKIDTSLSTTQEMMNPAPGDSAAEVRQVLTGQRQAVPKQMDSGRCVIGSR